MPGSNATLAIVILIPLMFAAIGMFHARRKRTTMEDYLTARNTVGTLVGTASLVATALGAWILFSPAETGTFAGLPGILGYALGSAAPLFAFIFIGKRLRELMPEGHSLTEYVWHRFGPGTYTSVLIVMVFYMFVFLTAELTGIALAVHLVAGTPLVVTAAIIGITTVVYTAYGGLKATIFTDTIQFIFIVPLLLLAFAGVIIGLDGPDNVIENVYEQVPDLLTLNNLSGWETGIALAIAILSANLFHQGYWQRVYASKDLKSFKTSFMLSALIVIPIVALAGLFGIMGMGAGVVDHPSTALFAVLKSATPSWLILMVLILAVALIMSSMDSLLNGLVSSFTSDLHRIKPTVKTSDLLWWARLMTVALAAIAVALATQGYSVLYMFLIADLVAVAVVVPVFAGLYFERHQGWIAIVGSLLGIITGALFFPKSDFTAWLDIPMAGNLMASFIVALLTSSLVVFSLVFIATVRRWGNTYDFQKLKESVHSFTE